MIEVDAAFGRYVAGESDVVVGSLPTMLRDQPKAIIWCHGSGETGPTAATNWKYQLRGLALHASVHVGDLGGQTWGGDTVVTRIGQAIDHLTAQYGAALPVALVGMSMGGCSALNYAVRFPERVSCVAALIPLTDLATARQNVYITARWPEIDAIYGAPPAADYTGHNPIDFAADLDPGLPIKIWSSTDDPLVTPATVNAFLAARPQTQHQSMGAVGHNISHATTDSLVGFIARHHLNP